MTDEDERELETELARLQQEHRDLDAAIDALHQSPAPDLLRLQRLKKRKLQLRDRIAFIEDQITPDIIALDFAIARSAEAHVISAPPVNSRSTPVTCADCRVWQKPPAFGQILSPTLTLAGGRDDLDRRPAAPDRPGELQPIHGTRHLDIGEDHRDIAARFQDFDRLIGIAGFDNLEPAAAIISTASIRNRNSSSTISTTGLLTRQDPCVSLPANTQ